jgi:hypothetical protein
MLIKELIESNKPGMYVYHASYLPDQAAGLKSILTKGLQPSAEGYAGPGVYFAYDPEGGYYHVSKEEATMFRVKWADLVNKFGTYPTNPNGIERDENEIIVPGVVPASMLEVEYFPDEWWDLKSALAASRGPIDEADEPTRIKLGGGNSAARAWIEKVYAKYPQTFQNNHVMPLGGSGDEQQFAMFELVPSFSKRGAVEVKWFQAYPLRSGVGSRAMKELQAMAREDGISLTLFPWDKGQVSQSKLTKFYRGQGFSPTAKGSKAMQWEPVGESSDPNVWETSLTIGEYLDPHSAEFEDPDDYLDSIVLIDAVEDQIDAGVKPKVVAVNPEQLFATQDWLSNYGSDGSMFDEYDDLPVVYKKNNKAYILDGHHRVAKASKSHTPIKVYLFA